MPVIRKTVIALAAAVSLLASVGAPVVAGPEDQLEEVERSLERERARLRESSRERRGVLAALEESDRERERLSARIAELGGDLEAARSRLSSVQARLNVAKLQLVRATRDFDRARGAARDQQAVVDARAATAYKVGAGGYLDALLGSDDLGAFLARSYYLRKVLVVDSSTLAGLHTARSSVRQQRSVIEELEAQLSEEEATIAEQVEEIERLRAEQREARGDLDLEIDYRQGLLADIETTRQRFQQAVRDLEAESARIQSVLQAGGSAGQVRGSGQLLWPTNGPIVSGFGWRTHPIFGTRRFHSGVDIDGACGQPIWAADDGRVVSSGWNGGYGQTVVIDHGGGMATLYAHQSKLGASGGQQVRRDQTIGWVGTTGWSTGCHLHFEVRINGTPVDPVPYLR
jgi:murein DD-endopeptidase MepM/ murein hydrolase activator NlpD